MTTPLLACVASEERMPDRELVRSKRRAENPERGRGVKIGFLNANKVDRMGRKKVKYFSAPGSKTSSIPLKSPERVRGGEEAGGAEVQPGARDGGGRAEEGDIRWADGG